MTLATEIDDVARGNLTLEQAEALLAMMAGGESPAPEEATAPAIAQQAPPTLPTSEIGSVAVAESRSVPSWDEGALRAVLESVPDAVIAVDRNGAVVLVNRSAGETGVPVRATVRAAASGVMFPTIART